ncbi:MAG: glycosyltransferase family 39 protein [Candidatus Falkowbacteria bacterium]|nr:glycosyltransferase family 39 protein [Candidatus Falkowbacteria bacterium]
MKLTKDIFYKLFKNQWPWLIIIPVAIGFFVFTSSFNYLSQSSNFVKWLSPDETANYTISKIYAQTGSLAFFEKYNLLVKDIIHPRSFRSDWGLIKPVSFLGLPIIYGTIADIFGITVLPYLTPLFAAIGLIFFYLLIKNIFGQSNALISTLLASVFPIYTYYSSRSMFHNVLFMVALIIGLYFLVNILNRNDEHKNYFKRNGFGFLFTFLSGLFIGIALAVRTSELLWLGPLLVFLWLFNIKRLGIVRPFIFLYGIFMAFMPIIYWNNVLYGSFISSGYPELNSSLFSLGKDGSSLASNVVGGKFVELKSILISIKQTIFHFGFNLAQSYKMFNAYVRNMFPWLFWSTGVGIVFFLAYFKDYKKSRWLFLIGWLGLSAVLVIYYGSWVFYDNPDPKSFTIGNSYTRYWLPLYFGALPFVSLALIRLTGFLRRPAAIWGLRMALIAVLATLSVQFVWLDPAEGLAVSIQKQKDAKSEWAKILDVTENNSVIITRYSDKLLFPERKVIIGLFDDKNMIAEYAILAKKIPTYYYNFSYKPEDVDYLNNGVLKEHGIALKLVEPITDRFSLYKLNQVTVEKDKVKKRK